MKIINVTSKEQLDELYNQSALTWEGLCSDEQNLADVERWLKEHDALIADTEVTAHIITGKLMNDTYSLTGSNAYPDDLTIIAIMDIYYAKIAIPRLSVGGRWFDDIIDNNARRESEKIQ